jgi:UDP-N-acetylmuramate--alanine ligase
LDIYPASEQPIEGITGETLARRISEQAGARPLSRSLGQGGDFVRYVSSFEDAVLAATADAQEGDMILTLGAGSVSQLAPMLLEKLKRLLCTITP